MARRSNAVEENDARLRVLLADDHLGMLESARKLLSAEYRVVASVNNGRIALETARELNPDLVVLDIEMPEMDGIRAAQEMRRLGLKARILFLTVHNDEDYVAAARESGDGYVLKSRMATDLPHAIKEALKGRFFVSHRILEAG